MQISHLPREIDGLGFSLSPPSHSCVNSQIDRAKSTLGPGTKFKASKVIQDNAEKNESLEGLYFHNEPPSNKEQISLSIGAIKQRPVVEQRRQQGFPAWSRQISVRFHVQSVKPGLLIPAPHLEQYLLLMSASPQ